MWLTNISLIHKSVKQVFFGWYAAIAFVILVCLYCYFSKQVKQTKMTFRVKFKVILQLLIWLCLTQLILTAKSRCNSSLCDCSDFIDGEYQYQTVISCPVNEPIVRYEIMNYTDEFYINRLGHPFIKTFIYCKTSDQLVYDVLAETDVEYFDSVQYINCSTPLNSSLGKGMPILEEIIFESDTGVNEWKAVNFDGLINLVELDIETETINQLPNDTFSMSSKLKKVNLKMKSPNLYLFPSVEEFRLSGLDGDNFITDALKNNPNLKSVSIFGSKFNLLTSRPLEGLILLKELTFGETTFNNFESNFLNKLVNLEKISFYSNELESLPNGIFNKNKKLKKIEFQTEKFTTLPNQFFGDLPELNAVSIIYCSKLNSLPNDLFQNSDNIETIILISTVLTTLPEGIFDNLLKLNSLHLDNNKLSSLPSNLFKNLKSLKSLSLGSNQFKSISAANIKVASNSLDINLQLNQIEDIRIEDLSIFEKNTTVNLGFNRISKFSGIVHLRQNIKRYNSTVLLRENPFNCSTCDVYHVVQERGPEYDDPDDFVTKPFSIDTFALKCSEPSELVSQTVRKLDFKMFECSLD